MALGSKKRDYKTEDRAVRASLAWHDGRTKELEASGSLTHDQASKKAYVEWIAMPDKSKKKIIKSFNKPMGVAA